MYKIVYNKNGRHFSAITEGEYRLEYKVGETTIPKIGKIFVFNTIEDAKNFGFCNSSKLFTCEVTNPIRALYRSWSLDFPSFWNLNKHTVEVPLGTYYVDSCKLLKEVKL